MIYLIAFAVPTILTLFLLPVLAAESQSRRNRARKPAEERGFALLQAWLGPPSRQSNGRPCARLRFSDVIRARGTASHAGRQ
jgi:hypothetical protein